MEFSSARQARGHTEPVSGVVNINTSAPPDASGGADEPLTDRVGNQPTQFKDSKVTGRRYANLRTDIWRDGDWRALSADAQWLYELLLSQPNLNTAGILALQQTKWSRCARDMTVERVAAAVGELCDTGFIKVDTESEEVLIRSFVRHGLMGSASWKLMRAAYRCATATQSHALRACLLAEFKRIDGHDKAELVADLNELVDTLSDTLSARASIPDPIGSVSVSVSSVSSKGNQKEESVVTYRGTSLGKQNGAGSPAARKLVMDNLPRHVLSVSRQRAALEQQVDEMLASGCSPVGIAFALQEWVARPDQYPGHLPHIYSELARRIENRQSVVPPPPTKAESFLNAPLPKNPPDQPALDW